MTFVQILLLLSCLAPWLLRFAWDARAAFLDFSFLALVLLYSQGVNVGNTLWAKVDGALSPILIGSAAVILSYGLLQMRRPWRRQQAVDMKANGETKEAPNDFLKPLFFPCRTTHTRLFPKVHSFSYSYLCVGIPVGWRGSANSILSADVKALQSGDATYDQSRISGRGWFSVDAADYLARGEGHLDLQGKLHAYLRKQVRKSDVKFEFIFTNV